MDSPTLHSDHPSSLSTTEDSARLLYYYRTLPEQPSFYSPNPDCVASNDVPHKPPHIEIKDPDNELKPAVREYRILGSETDEPTSIDFDHLRLYATELFTDDPVTGKCDKYSLNWLSVSDLLSHQGSLDSRSQSLLRLFVKSKWDNAAWLENGLKTTNGKLSQAMLLLLAAEAWNIIPNGHTIIESNLRSKDGKYSSKGVKRRFLSPQAARRQIYQFKKTYAPEKLFPEHHAYIVLFESGDDLRNVGNNPSLRRCDYERFFDRNRDTLKSWKKSGKIRAYLLSHEITCLSITDTVSLSFLEY